MKTNHQAVATLLALLALTTGCDVASDLVAPVTKTSPVMPSDYYQPEDHPVAPSTPATSGAVVQPPVADDKNGFCKTVQPSIAR